MTPVGVTLASISHTEGTAFNGTVATFTAVDMSLTASDFTATIDWGDGTQSTGVITGSAGSFTVSAPHTYAYEDPYTVSVSVTETGYSPVSASETVSATEADSLTAVPDHTTRVEGELSTIGAGFMDTNVRATAGDFTATIHWGDGTTSAGTVSGGNGRFGVSGSHAYAEEGLYFAGIVVTDAAPGSATVRSRHRSPSRTPPLAAAGTTLVATIGQPLSATVATFTHANPAGVASDYTATIDWGDGVTTAGTISANGSGFGVTGTHTYRSPGAETATVAIHDEGGAGATASTAVAVAAPPPPAAITLTLTKGVSASQSGPFSTSLSAATGSTV